MDNHTRRELVGQTPIMRNLRRELWLAARSDSTVLLSGETGTGKGLAAREVHRLSQRAGRAFVHLDCAALSPTLVESTLFGHERGAFTGATERRRGHLERAGDGTVFLDEIGELAPELQVKLLRVLQDREFERLGGGETLGFEARVVAATHRSLMREVYEGRFRADLFYRLRVFEVKVPALRERFDDLELLVRAELGRIAARLGTPVPRVAPDLWPRVRAHAWPGNVRELVGVLESLVARYPGEVIDAVRVGPLLESLPVGPLAAPRFCPSRRRVEQERHEILVALAASGGNVSRAARALGLPRSTLRYRLGRAEGS